MTDRIEEIRARCEAATPGPWDAKIHNEEYGQGYGETTYFVDIEGELFKIGLADNNRLLVKYRSDTDFIAHARADIPYLLDLLAERDEECNDLRSEVISIAQQSFERMRELARLEAEVVRLREAYRWIPVTEGLPEPNTETLVLTDAGSIRQGYIGHATGHWCSGGFVMVPTVTHWMPLPKPPKEEKE